jgi:RNA polymerase sigma-70 factor, ECF subfamily
MWDQDEFAELYRRFNPVALRAAQRVLRDRAAAEDVAQDVFAHLWERPSNYDPARGSLASYVAMVARSRAVDRWRSRQAYETATARMTQEAAAGAFAGGADELAIRRDRSRRALSALQAAPQEQRQAVLLAYGAGMSAREIAQATQVPVGTAKSRIRLGLIHAHDALDKVA